MTEEDHHHRDDEPNEVESGNFREATSNSRANHNHAAPHHHQQHTSRELRSSESILEYMQEIEEDVTNERSHEFSDVIQAQKHLKERGRRRSTLLHNQQQKASHVAEEEGFDDSSARRSTGQSHVHHHHHHKNKHRRATVNALANFARRQSAVANNEEWQAFLRNQEEEGSVSDGEDPNELTGIAENGDDADGSDDADNNHGGGHSLSVPWYCRPVQRQRWDDDQVLPHINWGDLFFDLFYVTAAYNLGAMLISALGKNDWGRGILYFIAIFGPLYNIWENDVIYSSRYTLVDYSHRVVSVARFMCVGFAVISIKPLDSLGDKSSVETFCLVLSLFFESVMQIGLNLEVYWYGEGDRIAIQNHTAHKLVRQFFPSTIFYMIATIIAGHSFFSSQGDDDAVDAYGDAGGYADGDVDYAKNDTYADNSTYANNSTTEDGERLLRRVLAASSGCSSYPDDDGHRFLAGDDCTGDSGSDSKAWSIADVPLILCLTIYLINICLTMYFTYTGGKRMKKDKSIRERYVPSNIDYMIHRYGEWIMLMIGESILSLLIVDTTEASDYYVIVALGILTVIVLQLLKFESEPSSADGHALWRSAFASKLFSILIQVLSMSLISFGVSYKIMLTNVFQDEVPHRLLAALPAISDWDAASLYSGSLVVVLLSLELMLATHRGVKSSYRLLFQDMEHLHVSTMNWPLVAIVVTKIGLILFTATLRQWATHLPHVAIAGFCVVTAMAVTRIVGWGFVHHEKEIKHAFSFIKSQATDGIRLAASSLLPSERSSMGSKREIPIDTVLWDTSFDAVVVTDRIGLIKHVNNATLEEFGYSSPKELIGKNVSMLVGGDEAKHHHVYMAGFNRSEQKSTTIGRQRRLQARRKDESEFAVLIGIKEIPNSGLLVGYIRPSPESVLHEQESVSNVYPVDESSFDSVFVISTKGVIRNVNRTALGEFQYQSKDELIGQNISMLVGGGEAPNHDSYLERFDDEHRDSSRIGGNQKVLQAKRKDESEFPCIIGIRRDPGNDTLVGYLRNVTGIVPEDDLLKAKTKYLVDDTSFDSIIVIDEEGTILQINATAVEEFGYNAKAELLGKNISMLVGGGHAKHHSRYLKKFHHKNTEDTAIGKQRKIKARRKDGTDFGCVIGIRTIPETEWLIGYIRSTEGLTKKQRDSEYDNLSHLSTRSSTVRSRRSTDSNESESRASILDESFDAVVVATFDGVIRKVNQTVLDIFRYQSKDELIGQNLKILVGGGDDVHHDEHLKRFREEHKSSSQIGKQRVLYSKRKDGTQFPCIVGIKTTPKGDGLVGWIRDMSDIREQRSSITITNMTMLDPVDRLVDDASFDAIIVTTASGVIRRVNETTVREFRYASKEELVGQNVSMLVGGKVSAKVHDRYLHKFQEAGKSSSTIGKQRVLKSKRKDGTEFRCIIGIQKIPDATEDLLIGYIRNLEIQGEHDGSSEFGSEEATSRKS